MRGLRTVPTSAMNTDASDQEMSRQTSSLILHRINAKLTDTTAKLNHVEEHRAMLSKECEAQRSALRMTEAALAAAHKDASDAHARLAASERAARLEDERRTAAENAMKQRNAELRASFLTQEQAVARAESLAARLAAEAAALNAAVANAIAAAEGPVDAVANALVSVSRQHAAELHALLAERRQLNADLASLVRYLAVRSAARSVPASPVASPARRRPPLSPDSAGGGGGGGVEVAEREAAAAARLMGRAGEETYEAIDQLWGEVVYLYV
jgi:DNA repair exonuclease SbcCD ATPase subunit